MDLLLLPIVLEILYITMMGFRGRVVDLESLPPPTVGSNPARDFDSFV